MINCCNNGYILYIYLSFTYSMLIKWEFCHKQCIFMYIPWHPHCIPICWLYSMRISRQDNSGEANKQPVVPRAQREVYVPWHRNSAGTHLVGGLEHEFYFPYYTMEYCLVVSHIRIISREYYGILLGGFTHSDYFPMIYWE